MMGTRCNQCMMMRICLHLQAFHFDFKNWQGNLQSAEMPCRIQVRIVSGLTASRTGRINSAFDRLRDASLDDGGMRVARMLPDVSNTLSSSLMLMSLMKFD